MWYDTLYGDILYGGFADFTRRCLTRRRRVQNASTSCAAARETVHQALASAAATRRISAVDASPDMLMQAFRQGGRRRYHAAVPCQTQPSLIFTARWMLPTARLWDGINYIPAG